MDLNSRTLHLIAILLITAAVMGIFGQTYFHQLLGYDDPYFVSHVPEVTSGLSLDNLWWAWTTSEMSIWHPLTWLSLQIETELFGAGNDSARFLSNTLLHLANALLVYLIALRLRFSQVHALLVALLFAVHPQHVEVVAWISNRKELLASFFGLLALWKFLVYRESGKAGAYFLSLFFFVLAMLSKVSAAPLAILLPVFCFLDAWYEQPRTKLSLQYWKNLSLKWLPFIATAVSISLITINLQATNLGEKLHSLDSSLNFLLMIGVRFAWYVSTSFWPATLSMMHTVPESLSGSVIAYSALTIAVFLAVVWRFRCNKVFLIGISWFILFLAPTIGIVPVDAIFVADRYSYQAHIGLFVAMAGILRQTTKSAKTRPVLTRVTQIVPFLVIIAFSLISWKHTAIWKDTISLFERETALNPANETPLIQLGYAHFINQDYEKAKEYLNRAVATKPDGFYGYAYLGFVEDTLKDYAAAEAWYLKAIERDEPYAFHHVVDVYEHLVWVSSTLKKHEQAVRYLKKGLEYFPDSAYLQELRDYYKRYYPVISTALPDSGGTTRM